MEKKEFFINAVEIIDIDGSKNIPTALYYQKGKPTLIGSAALSATNNRLEINEDFKVDLGFIDPKSTSLQHRIYPIASGGEKSAAGLSYDFLSVVFSHARNWLIERGLNQKVSVMLAEPLALEGELASPVWLSKYRKNLERILGGEKYDKISFLPEPFAVFQYYRHCLRHPAVAGVGKQNVLIVDFGGGTFDVCIIETTKEGDISQTGRNSKPLAAASSPVGGFFINRMIAEHLIRKHFGITREAKTKIGKGLDVYKNWRKNNQDLSTLSAEYQNFLCSFHSLIYKVESVKLGLCKNIMDWRLETDLDINYPIIIPAEPFSSNSKMITVKLTANELREIFISMVWNRHLKVLLRQTLERGKDDLIGSPISVVLLSGGSANIGWLSYLIQNEFQNSLSNAQILKLSDFQEVVAKGLAVECARRFYNKAGDFSSVTYNRLCLLLDADKIGYEPKPFRPRISGLPDMKEKPGVLLPSASLLESFFEKPMLWRVKLTHAPRNQLDYYFLKSSFDPEDLDSLQNVENHTVFTPKDCKFDAYMQVQLIVKPDGTAIPRFIYKTGRTEDDRIQIDGKPFYLDMTCSQVEVLPSAYIGLDFGTSNTSISYVDQLSIATYKTRANEKGWVDLSDLSGVLPYPLAAPLSQYLAQSDPNRIFQKAREVIESALCLGAYIAYSEYCVLKSNKTTRIFKGFTQRSIGPLWKLLRESLIQLGNKGRICARYNDLVSEGVYKIIEQTVDFLSKAKHEKADLASFDLLRPIKILANISHNVFAENRFGFFENVQKQKFSKEYKGLFREAIGSHPPFVKAYAYSGPASFSKDEAILYNLQEGYALRLQPLIFWDSCINHRDIEDGHCYLFDKLTKGIFSFKAVGYPCTCEATESNEYDEIAACLQRMRDEDIGREFEEIGPLGELNF
jgi:hypothetical protein